MVKYSNIDTKYSTAAKKFEKKAREYKNENSVYYAPKATESYEYAADSWVKDSAKRKDAGEEFRNSLSYAINDYNSAIKSLGRQESRELKRIEGKRKSVEDKLESSIKKRDNRAISERGLVVRTINSELALPILSIVAFSSTLIFSSFSVTGFAINNNITSFFNYIALACFSVGLIFALVYLKEAKKRKGQILR